MARLCDLPEEVLEEIMSLLIPETLRGFKCVSKSWYAFINGLMNDPEFVAKHLRNMENKMMSSPALYFQNLMVVDSLGGQGGSLEKRAYLLSLANDNHVNCDDIPCVNEKLEVLIDPTYAADWMEMCHCNGIICLSKIDRKDNFVLVNPSLKEMKLVPVCLPLLGVYEVLAMGFGCDSVANDYKVVAIWSHVHHNFGPCKAQIYNLSNDSWKEIQMQEEIIASFVDYQVEYFNGVCYWYYWNEKMRITSFDFGDEVFCNIPVPDLAESDNWVALSDWTRIGVWNESLVLFYYGGGVPVVIEMWARDLYRSACIGVEGSHSWSKYLIIGPMEFLARPLAIWGEDQLYMETEVGEIISYSLSTEKVDARSVYLKGSKSHLVFYVKSLVSLVKREGREA